MNNNLKDGIVLFFLLVIIQIPMLHNWVIYSVAFPFQYIGFIILLPHRLPRSWIMVSAFMIGLLVDLFSNTPGMHAGVSVIIATARMNWLKAVSDVSDEDFELTLGYLKVLRFVLFVLPLVFLHHTLIFLLENEGFSRLGRTLNQSFWSSILSSSLILLGALIILRQKRR